MTSGITGASPKPISQPKTEPAAPKAEVNKAGAAVGAAAAKGAAGAESASKAQTDTFGSAKISAEAKMLPKGLVAGGCCMPPPTDLKLPGGGLLKPLDLEGWKLKNDAKAAKAKFDKTAKDATSDGKITNSERREVNSDGRDWKIADKKVDLHEAQQAQKKAMDSALKDGNITPFEQARINAGQAKIDGLQKELNGLVAADKKQDRKDMWDRFGENIRPTPSWGQFPITKPGGDLGPGGKPGIDPGGKPGIEPGKLPGWNPGDIIMPGGRPFPLPDFKLPDLKPLPFKFPELPGFPKPPSFDFLPKLFESFKLW